MDPPAEKELESRYLLSIITWTRLHMNLNIKFKEDTQRWGLPVNLGMEYQNNDEIEHGPAYNLGIGEPLSFIYYNLDPPTHKAMTQETWTRLTIRNWRAAIFFVNQKMDPPQKTVPRNL